MANQLFVLENINLSCAVVQGGIDGSQCSIEYGADVCSLTYKFWSPDYDTTQRGLTKFLRLCKIINEIGGLNPDDIL